LRTGSCQQKIAAPRNKPILTVPQNPLPAILVTRSEPGASETAVRLRQAGFAPVVEPLFTIAAIKAEIPDFDALAFTSVNGVRQFARLSPRRDARVFCVGARTAEAARETGFADVASADGDVEALGALIAGKLRQGARLLHAGNAESRGDLAGRLVAAGHAAAFVAIFEAVPVPAPKARLAAVLDGSLAIDAVLIHSPRAAAILAGFVDGAGRGARLPVAAISEAAAAPLAGWTGRVEIAATPDEQALISALARLVFG
jgi:uroporphyrinogen-III synthase